MFDIYGNRIASNDSDVYAKVYSPSYITNLIDDTKSVIGSFFPPSTVNSAQTALKTSDYIKVLENNTYVFQYKDSRGKLGNEKIYFFDNSKNYVRHEEIIYTADGTYHWFKYTPTDSGYIRFQYISDENAEAMVFIGDSLCTTYVPYDGTDFDKSKFKNSLSKELHESMLDGYIRNNLYGKTIYWFGDSNSDNWASSAQRMEFEKKFGCKVKSFGRYGAFWGDPNGKDATGRTSAMGQYNELLTSIEIDPSTYRFPDDTAFFFMMGTNTGAEVGTMPAGGVKDLDENGITDISAMKYVLHRINYYSRNNPIGVFIPWECSGAKRDALIEICEYYCIPYFDITKMCPPYNHTMGLVRPDGTTVQNDYYTDGGVHLAVYGWEKFRRIAENWMAYQC